MPVMIVKPLSCRVQDTINAWLDANSKEIVMIDPKTGLEIENSLLDIPVIGLSYLTHVDVPMGFREPANRNTDPKVYIPDAILALEIDPKSLPHDLQHIEGEFWLFELTSDRMLETVGALADTLFQIFGINIVIMPDQVHDEDIQHRTTEAVSAAFPGVIYCPIVPKKEA